MTARNSGAICDCQSECRGRNASGIKVGGAELNEPTVLVDSRRAAPKLWIFQSKPDVRSICYLSEANFYFSQMIPNLFIHFKFVHSISCSFQSHYTNILTFISYVLLLPLDLGLRSGSNRDSTTIENTQ